MTSARNRRLGEHIPDGALVGGPILSLRISPPHLWEICALNAPPSGPIVLSAGTLGRVRECLTENSVAKNGRGTAAALRVHGEMNIYRAGEIAQAILSRLQQKPAAARIDLSEVTEIDSAGLQILLMADKLAVAAGRRLKLVAPSACVREVLTLCNLRDLIEGETA